MTKDLPPSNPRPSELSGDSHRDADGGFFAPVNNKANPLPIDIIRESLEFNSSSPTNLRWKTRPRSHFNADRAWSIWNTRYAKKDSGNEYTNSGGKQYYQISINGKTFQAHRVVYAIVYGTDPGELHIDHIDNNGLNNNPANLRLATQAENLRNRGKTSRNKSGFKGVVYDPKWKKFVAYIRINGRNQNLGGYATKEAASEAYESAARQYFGKFHHQPTI